MADAGHSGGPYRIFFPVGVLFAAWGALVWLLYERGRLAYPGALHADLMLGGFLLSFVVGFLLTAIPRFTDTRPAGGLELSLAGAALAVQLAAGAGLFGALRRALVSHAAMAALLLVACAFVARRFATRRSTPPPTMLLGLAGLGAGTLGALVVLASDLGVSTGAWGVLGRLLLVHGMVPALLLGIGSRLVPSILGWSSPTGLVALGTPAPPVSRPIVAAVTLAWFGSFVLEAFGPPVPARLVRALLATVIVVRLWNVHRTPPRRGSLATCLRAGAASLVLGMWGSAVFPGHFLHFAHLTFIGGLGLTTLAVATRVVLSHGGTDLKAELDSKTLVWVALLALAAAVTRVVAGFTGTAYVPLLALAALLWLLALAAWAIRFGRLALPRRGDQAR